LKVGVFCASNHPKVNRSIIRYLRLRGCERIVVVVTQPRQVELPSEVVQVEAKANLGNVSKLIGRGDQVEWVLSGAILLNVLLAHQWHKLGEQVNVMVSWWDGLGYKRRFYPNKLKGTPEDPSLKIGKFNLTFNDRFDVEKGKGGD